MTLISTRNIVILAVLLISVVLAARALLHSRILGPKSTFDLIPDNVDLTLKDIKYTKTRDGEPLWTLVANSAAHSMEEGITRIEDVRMVFFDQERGDMRLTSDRGELRAEDQVVVVSSNVVVVSSQGNTLQTDYLEYDEVSNILQTDRRVKIDADHYKVKGTGMQVDVTERTLILLDDVTAQSVGIDNNVKQRR